MIIFFYIISINCVQVFSKYEFYEVVAFNSHERDLLYNIFENLANMYFLNGITNEAATLMDVAVDSCCTNYFELTLYKYDIEYSRIVNEEVLLLNTNITDSVLQQTVLQKFLTWDDMLLWVDNKVQENSALTKTVIAKTFEHRDIFVLKLSADKRSKKMAVFIVAGEEGRDWLSSALLLNYINRTLESASSPDSLLNYYDMYFIPVLNPDGFVYTKEKDRMWTKNRKIIHPPQTCENHDDAVGINIDRNWFRTSSDSKYACNLIYSGSIPLSEEETQGLSYILNSIALKLVAFINLRGFGNLITLPYAYDKIVPNNHNILLEIMKHTSAVMKLQHNKCYPVGTTATYFYNFSGNMPDWVKENLNIPIVFTIYMQHDRFLPKESHILPLTEQLESLLNISLTISKEIYGSLYNSQMKNTAVLNIIIINFICAYTPRFFWSR